MAQETAIDGKTLVTGLIGNPVGHSFSPLIHNTISQKLGENMVYVPLPVENGEQLGDAIRGAYAMGFAGLNVTVPYKQAVIPFLKEIDPVAEAIGAVNTLVRTDGGYKGYNTDYKGLRRALEAEGVTIWNYDVVLVGAGGAARAAGFMCGEAGVKHLAILNRTQEKAEALAADIRRVFPKMEITCYPLSQPGRIPFEKFLAIQCTKVGLYPNTQETPIQSPMFFRRAVLAYDCIYNPEETLFLRKVREHGHTGWGGTGMLLYQGVESHEYWTGKRIPDEAVKETGHLLRSCFRRSRKNNLVLVGFMGSGKTTVGKTIARKTGASFVDTDSLIVEESGMKVSEIFQKEGEGGFRNRETALLSKLSTENQENVIYATGGGVVIRKENHPYLREIGTVVLLDVTEETVIRRLGKDSTRPLLQGPDRAKKVRTLLVRRIDAYRSVADYIIDADHGTPDEIADRILAVTGFAEGKKGKTNT